MQIYSYNGTLEVGPNFSKVPGQIVYTLEIHVGAR